MNAWMTIQEDVTITAQTRLVATSVRVCLAIDSQTDRNALISMNVSREQIIVMIMQLASITLARLAVPAMSVTLEMALIVKVCFSP